MYHKEISNIRIMTMVKRNQIPAVIKKILLSSYSQILTRCILSKLFNHCNMSRIIYNNHLMTKFTQKESIYLHLEDLI